MSLIAALPLGLTAFARKFHFLDFRAAGWTLGEFAAADVHVPLHWQ